MEKWLADNLFFPPIIKACQLLNWTQYQFARNVIAFGYVVGTAFEKFGTFTWYAFAFFSLLFIAAAVLTDPESPSSPSDFIRYMMYPLFLICIFWTHEYNVAFTTLAVLFSEFALLIKRIPPADAKKFVDKVAFS